MKWNRVRNVWQLVDVEIPIHYAKICEKFNLDIFIIQTVREREKKVFQICRQPWYSWSWAFSLSSQAKWEKFLFIENVFVSGSDNRKNIYLSWWVALALFSLEVGTIPCSYPAGCMA